MLNFTVVDISSCLTQYANPHRKKSGRREKKFRRRVLPHILNRASSTHSIRQHGLRFKYPQSIDRSIGYAEGEQEMRWLAEHGHEYAGQWVALDGNHLLSHGESAREVYEAARKSGVKLPLVVRVDSKEQLPFGGW